MAAISEKDHYIGLSIISTIFFLFDKISFRTKYKIRIYIYLKA